MLKQKVWSKSLESFLNKTIALGIYFYFREKSLHHNILAVSCNLHFIGAIILLIISSEVDAPLICLNVRVLKKLLSLVEAEVQQVHHAHSLTLEHCEHLDHKVSSLNQLNIYLLKVSLDLHPPHLPNSKEHI